MRQSSPVQWLSWFYQLNKAVVDFYLFYLSVDAHVEEWIDEAIGIHQQGETPENTKEVSKLHLILSKQQNSPYVVFMAPTDYEDSKGHVASQEGASDDCHHKSDPHRGCSSEKGTIGMNISPWMSLPVAEEHD